MKAFVAVLILSAVVQAALADISFNYRNRYLPVIEGAPEYPDSRIVHGQAASRGQFPYQAALILDDQWFCGGSLISTSVVLTAAHCNYQIDTITVYLGAHNLNAVENGRIILQSRNHLHHANYDDDTLVNDIAIVRLPSAVALSNFIQLIALPRHSDSSQTFSGYTATASGWGLTSDTAVSTSPHLNFVSLPIITNSECSSIYGSETVISSTICTSGANGRNICSGDSGGPLVVNHDGAVIQVGIVSFGAYIGCEVGLPAGFARTTSFLNWIATHAGVTVRP